MLSDAIQIFVNILLPVLVIVAAGAGLQSRKALHVSTLATLNMYLFVPVYLFQRIVGSNLSWREIGQVGLVVLLPIAVLSLAMYAVLRRRGAAGATTAAMICGGLFFNAGNFGIPISELAFGSTGGGVQALVMMFINLSIFVVGYAILALGQGQGTSALLGFLKLPYPYFILAALAVRDLAIPLPHWLELSFERIAAGMVPLALTTLGAQLASQARWPRWRLIAPVMLIKLVLLPCVTAALVYGLGLWPWPGAQLILASSAPTAVNILLLTMELKGDAETAAECVFWTTIGSALSVSIVLSMLHWAGGQQLPTP